MALAVGGLAEMPAWASGWTPTSAQPLQPFLSPQQNETLAEITETLIPASDSPGAKTLGVQDFIQKMIEDCYETDVQDRFRKGLDTVNALANSSYGKPFVACDATQRQEVLKKLEQAPETDQKQFFAQVKNLTIQGYTTSEYVMTQHLNYIMAPGHYYGCVPLPAKVVSQTK